MSRPPLVSVLMPTYNNGPYIAQAIESVLAQSLQDLELVVVNNASTDNTAEILKRYARLDPRVRVFHNPKNIGLCANFNRCFRESHPQSKYFCFLPSDDYWAPEFLQEVVGAAEANPQVALVHTDGYKVSQGGEILKTYMDFYKNLPPAGVHRALRELYRNNYVFDQTILVRKDLFKRYYLHTQPFNEAFAYLPGYVMFIELMTRGATFYYHPGRLVFFREHPGSQTLDKNIIPRVRDEVKVFEYLAGVCPPELEELRQEELANRLAALAFLLIESRKGTEARPLLKRARQLARRARLDVRIAQLITALSIPATLQAQLWRMLVGTSQIIKRA